MDPISRDNTVQCRRIDCDFYCSYNSPEKWREHSTACSSLGTLFRCPFVGCKSGEMNTFDSLQSVYEHENNAHAVWVCGSCRTGFLTQRKAFGHVLLEHEDAADTESPGGHYVQRKWVAEDTKYPSDTGSSVNKEDCFDLAHGENGGGGDHIQVDARRVMRSCRAIEEDACATQTLMPDACIGDWIADVLEHQLDSTARFLATVPGGFDIATGASTLLTTAHLDQLASKAKDIYEALERRKHEYEQQRDNPEQHPRMASSSTRPRSVHWDNVGIPEVPVQSEVEETLAMDPVWRNSQHRSRSMYSSTSRGRSRSPTIVSAPLPRPSPRHPFHPQRTWPLARSSAPVAVESATPTSYDTDFSSEDDSAPPHINSATGEPLLPQHLPAVLQKTYFIQLEEQCILSAWTFFTQHHSSLSTTLDRRRQPVCKVPITSPRDLTLPQWTHLLRRLADAKGIKHDMVSRLASFNGEIQPVDEVRHAVVKEKVKSDRDLLALVQAARTFCWQLRDWDRCRGIDGLYRIVEQEIGNEKREKRRRKMGKARTGRGWGKGWESEGVD